MAVDYEAMAERAVEHARRCGLSLDYTLESSAAVDTILDAYHGHLRAHPEEYGTPEGAENLWNVALYFGIYLGELLLRVQLAGQGFVWDAEGRTIPVLRAGENMQMSPITKAHKRILNGPADSVQRFCEVALQVAGGNVPRENLRRVVDVILPDGSGFGNVLQREAGSLLDELASGKWEYLTFRSRDGVLQITGFGRQFFLEFVKGQDHYTIIDPAQAGEKARGRLVTPFGMKTPLKRAILTREQMQEIVDIYYGSIGRGEFLREVSSEKVEWKL